MPPHTTDSDPTSSFAYITIDRNHSDMRLDRFCRGYFPGITQGIVAKAVRTGLIRIDGKKVEIAHRTAKGQELRVPKWMLTPQESTQIETDSAKPAAAPSSKWVATLKAAIIYEDNDILVINKPAGIAVQGGTGIVHSVDSCLPFLTESEEPLRLVHRLDKDTSGILVLAKNRHAAAEYTRYLRERQLEKYYLALVLGNIHPLAGLIQEPIQKQGSKGQEKMVVAKGGDKAETYYKTLDRVGEVASLVQLQPITGRTHQLRVHLAHLGNPIVGDGKYGAAFHLEHPAISSLLEANSKKLHLHAWRLVLPTAQGRKEIVAPLPDLLATSCKALGLMVEAKRR
jgi:23S rRNA pseudouridine955/2504/2580 synthase